jgi:hypothetical protein
MAGGVHLTSHVILQVLKSALQIVAAERSIKNAAAATAARRHVSASPESAAPSAKRFAAAAPAAGGDAASPTRPIAKPPRGDLSPRASSMSAAMNNGLYPTPSTATLQPAPPAGSPSRSLETQRSAFSYGAASAAAAANGSAPALLDAIADVNALEVLHRHVAFPTNLDCQLKPLTLHTSLEPLGWHGHHHYLHVLMKSAILMTHCLYDSFPSKCSCSFF